MTVIDAPASDGSQPADGGNRHVDRATAVLVALFVLVGIGTPLLGLTVFAGTDILFQRAPWSYLVPNGFVPQNKFVGDTVDGFLPATREFLDRLRAGDFPQWWPYNSGGAQLGSVPNVGMLSPISLPYYLLPLSLAPGYVKLLEMVVAVLGSYLFLRRLSLRTAPALLGGLVFVSSGFMIAWTNWPQTRTAALIPALFWAVERLVQRRGPGDVALLAAVVAGMLFGGFPSVTWYALVSAGLYCLVRVGAADRGNALRGVAGLAMAAGGVALGVAVAALQLLPFVQELGAISTGNREQNAGSHSPIENLVLAVAGDAFGGTNPAGGGIEWFGPGHPVEEFTYVGAAALVLVLLGSLARRRPGLPPGVRAFFVVGLVLTVLVMFVGGPFLEALQQLPVFSENRIGRARSVMGFFAAVLAALGFDALLRGPAAAWTPQRRRLWLLTRPVAGAGAVAVAGVVAFLARRRSYAAGHADVFHGSMLRAALFGLVAVIAVAVAVRARDRLRTAALVALPALVVAQALTVVLPFWPRVPPEQFYPVTPTHQFLADNLGHDRLFTADVMMTGTESYYGLRTSGGRGFISAEYEALLQLGCPDCFVSPTYVSGPADPGAFDPDILDLLATKYLVTDPAAPVPGTEELLEVGSDVVALLPDEPVEVVLPPGGLRAVGVTVTGDYAPAGAAGRLRVVLRAPGGEVVVDTERRLGRADAGRPVYVAVPEEAARTATTASITVVDEPSLSVRGRDGTPRVGLIRPADDRLEIVAAGGATVYERLTAAPRIRWAESSAVQPDALAAGAALRAGSAPDVLLSTPGPAASGAPATVDVVTDSGDAIEVAVGADGSGYLVVADGLQDRWSAELDGEPVDLLDADLGLVAVAVPEGDHVVRLAYEPPAGGAGYLVSAVAAAAVVGLALLDRFRRRARGNAAR